MVSSRKSSARMKVGDVTDGGQLLFRNDAHSG